MGRIGRRRPGRALAGAAVLGALVSLAGCSGGSAAPRMPAASAAAHGPSTGPTPSAPTTTAPAPAARRTSAPSRAHTTPPTRPPVAARSVLPLALRTGAATQVVTVTASSTASTQGTLQAWRRISGGWNRVGPAIHAWLGADGLSTQPSESRSATPIGSFTLTQAFGRDADPGTALPYTRTTPADWWISQPGPLYNTRQRCARDCGFALGPPNEHLYDTIPYYRYAVVIDYNTRNAPGGVRAGAGSAFFLHVTVGAPTQGCVSIDQAQLVRLLRWLTPSRHPRILIGSG